MRILFIHQNCPGQYKHLAPLLASRPENEVVFISRARKPNVPGVKKVEYRLKRRPKQSTHHYVRNLESGVLYGQAVARAAMSLKAQGFVPDVVCAHPGWGESLFIKDVYPSARLLNYYEFYYRASGSDVGFDPEETVSMNDCCRVRTKNANQLLGLVAADWGISPTRWQLSQYPGEFHHKMSVIHDGIDIGVAIPKPDAQFTLPSGKTLTKGDEVVTYVARNLEPYRGFPTFMRAVEEICKRRPHCQVLVLGADGVSYGKRLAEGKTYRQQMLAEVTIDPERVHFLGRVAYDSFINALQVSSAHVYLTYPFVLSWSMLEAMSAGCVVVGSDTAPVTEVLKDGENGLLVDFFSPVAVADRVDEILDHEDRMAEMGGRARQTILERYELQACLHRQVRLIEELAAGRTPTVGTPRETEPEESGTSEVPADD